MSTSAGPAAAAGSRVAVVTGAAGGIGAATCRRLAADGFVVACLDLREADLAGLTAELATSAGPADPGARPARARGYAADVRDPASVHRAASRIRQELGEPWLLVNAAGVFSIGLLPDTDEQEWDRIVDTNLKGPFLTCREFLPAMIEAHDGCIINVASTAGVRGGRRRAAYCASKGGLVLLTRSLAIDHGPDGVRVNCLCPGLIDTEMADWIRHDTAAMAQFSAGAPAGRIGSPAEIAAAVAFLASADASYLHGAVVMADGGVTALASHRVSSKVPKDQGTSGGTGPATTGPATTACPATTGPATPDTIVSATTGPATTGPATTGRTAASVRPADKPASPGRRRASRLVDIAEAVGVHTSTVSRVLNGDPAQSVRPEIYEQILMTARQQGYRPNALARALKRRRTGAFAFVIPLLRNPIWVSLQRGALQRAAERGYVVMIMEEPTDDQKPPESYRYLVDESRADGLLIATSLRIGDHAGGVPVAPHVYVNRRGPHRGNNVVMDEPGAVRLFIDHVAGLGHRSVCLIDGSAEVDTVHRRVLAAKRICAGRGIRLTVLHAAATEEGGWDAAGKLLRAADRPTACGVGSLNQLFGVMAALRAEGVPVPEAMSLVSFDEDECLAFLDVPVTSVAMPLAELGSAAVDALIARVEGDPERDVLVREPMRLVHRDSVASRPA